MTEYKNISFEQYEDKVQVIEITEMILAQVNAARKAIISHNSVYSQAIDHGKYLYTQSSIWKVYDVAETEFGITRVVFWWEVDDGSYSVHFKTNSIEPEFYYYEN